MNIVQLHERVKFWVDHVASARFESDDIDQAINNAILEIVDEKYDHTRLNHRGDSFQKSQRIRDELSNITKTNDTDSGLTIQNNSDHVLVEIASFPVDYKYLLAIALFVSTEKYNCWPLTYDRKNVIEDNPYRRVRKFPNVKCYYIEDNTGIKILHPFEQAEPTKVEICYLANPVNVFYGYEKVAGEVFGLNTDFICALSPTSYKAVEYVTGTALTSDGITGYVDYGIAVVDFVNPSINGFLHEEIAKRGALNCLLSSGNFEKYKALKAEVLAT